MKILEYQYLVGCVILFAIWAIGFALRKDLRLPMILSGVIYVIVSSSQFFVGRLLYFVLEIGVPLVPNYWNPNTLFDLNRITGGLSIEDALFMFIVAGIGAYLYELIFNRKIGKRKFRRHYSALVIPFFIAFIFQLLFALNEIYPIIVVGVAGAVLIWNERRDLVKNSILGGATFVILYFLAFLIFNAVFPDYLKDMYILKNTSGIFLIGIPLEELMYAMSFGLFWIPMYEYLFGVGDIKLKDTN